MFSFFRRKRVLPYANDERTVFQDTDDEKTRLARLALLTSAKGEVDPLVLEILGAAENEGS
ncbi:hypothetical protein [Corynebacterium pseudogenitalium]|uniref:hypothetical protein n=1 Tax=Corynebacterium pseudogenitalium TaxID=38303 RepID=UPI00210E4849|nr:hypothetical protein [Corynebacterium pseudogenitalium]MCQ4607512.1 hypothetical protein [Corynebacterium pseudogenitalium]